MAQLIRFQGGIQTVTPPIPLTTFQILVGGFIEFVDLPSGKLMVVNELLNARKIDFTHFYNLTATLLTGITVVGDAVICSPGEIE